MSDTLVVPNRCETCGNVRFDGPIQHQCPLKGDNTMKISKSDAPITRGRQKAENPFMTGTQVTITAKMVKDQGLLEVLQGSTVSESILPLLDGGTYTIEVSDGEKPFTIINQMREAAEAVGMKVSVAPAAGVSAKVDKDTKVFRVRWSVKSVKS